VAGATFKLNFHLKVGINGQKIRGLLAANFQPCTQLLNTRKKTTFFFVAVFRTKIFNPKELFSALNTYFKYPAFYFL